MAPSPGLIGLTRAERTAVGRTYVAAIPADIAKLSPQVGSAVVAQAEEAVAEIRAFDAESRGEVGALASTLLRSESASSSQIEQLTASARAIAEAEVTGQGTRNAATIAANGEAMTAALQLADRLDVEAMIEMQRVLLHTTASHLVELREEPIWIGGGGSTWLSADFVPPVHTRVRPSLQDLAEFMARDHLPVLVQAAVAHAQFETIHPFADGNGRTGRAIVHALLRGKGITSRVTVPVSGGLLQDKAAYIASLDAYRAGDIEPVVTAFAVSSLRAVAHGRTMWRRLDEVRQRWRSAVTARADSAVWQLMDVLVAHPVLDAATAARELGTAETNVHRHLSALTQAGVLQRTEHYKSRRTLWRAPDVLAVVDAYSRDVGRRQR